MKRRVMRWSSSERHLARVAANAALRAAVREPQERALPGHPHRERRALAERDVRVVADPALRRAEHARVQDAVAGEDAPRPVVHAHRDADHDRALGIAQALGGGSVHVGVRERLLELRDGGAEERRIPLERLLLERDLVDRGHELSLFTAHFERQARNAARRRPAHRRRLPPGRPPARARRGRARVRRAGSRRRRPPRLRRVPPLRSAGRRACERRIQKLASPSSIVRPTRIATMPQPVGRTKSASAMETIRAI